MRYFLLLIVMVVLSSVFTCAQTTFTIKINQPPKLELDVENEIIIDPLDYDGILVLCEFVSITGGAEPYDYKWSPNVNLSDSTGDCPLAFLQNNIAYYIEVTDKNKCYVNDSLKIILNVNTGNDTYKSIEPEILIFPTPVSDGILFIKMVNIRKSFKYSIIDFNGRIIKDAIVNDFEFNSILEIPLHVSSGRYILKIDYDNISIKKQFIVIQN